MYKDSFREYVAEGLYRKYKLGTKSEDPTLTTKPAKSETKIPMDKTKQIDPAMFCGGDADRVLYSLNLPSQSNGYTHHCKRNDLLQQHLHCGRRNEPTPMLPSNLGTHINARNQSVLGVPTNEALDTCNGICGGHQGLYETDSTLGAAGNGSESSVRSQKSVKTVVSRKSSHELRKFVKSQCKLHEAIDENMKQMASQDDIGIHLDKPHCWLKEQSTANILQEPCKRCPAANNPVLSGHKDAVTEISQGDLKECRNTEPLTITVDDIVNSKVINPIIRKLQRMYLNNLKEEMSLMDDLERMPHQVNEVYKAAISKPQND